VWPKFVRILARGQIALLSHLGGTGFSLCDFNFQRIEKAHRLKSLCENYNSKAPAAEAALILRTLRHG